MKSTLKQGISDMQECMLNINNALSTLQIIAESESLDADIKNALDFTISHMTLYCDEMSICIDALKEDNSK